MTTTINYRIEWQHKRTSKKGFIRRTYTEEEKKQAEADVIQLNEAPDNKFYFYRLVNRK